MSSSDEMYERGSQDATQDDLNPFYYQHYYHYRRGYNTMRRRLRQQHTPEGGIHLNRFWLIGLIVAVLSGAGIVLWSGISEGMFGTNHASLSSAAAVTASPLAIASPTPTPLLVPSPLPIPRLQAGANARIVNVGESPLLVRQEPGINAPVQVRLALDTQVTILDGPVEADGYTWWQVESKQGRGWSAERNQDGMVWLEPIPDVQVESRK